MNETVDEEKKSFVQFIFADLDARDAAKKVLEERKVCR